MRAGAVWRILRKQGKRRCDEVFPWDVDKHAASISRDYLLAERRDSLMARTTPDCRNGCLSCGLREAGLCV